MVQETKNKRRPDDSKGNGKQDRGARGGQRATSEARSRVEGESRQGTSRGGSSRRDPSRGDTSDRDPSPGDVSRGQTSIERYGGRSSSSAQGRGASGRAQSPFGLMTQLSQEMDRLFDDFWRDPFGRTPARSGQRDTGDVAGSTWIPDLEIHTHDGELIVRADLPGMKKDDVEVDVTDGVLTIQGERRQGCEEDLEGGYRSECRYGLFVRSIPLPEGIDPEDVTAGFEDGVLEVRMPAPERRSQDRRNIQVRGRDSSPRGT